MINPLDNTNLSQNALYSKLNMYYKNNGLYDSVQRTDIESMKPLRTVVNRSVEFFVSKLLREYQISTENVNLRVAIEQILTWSNFKTQSRVAIRNDALYGNLFWKVNCDGEKVWFEIIEPSFITSFQTDNRGFITEIRIDVPVTSEGRNLTHTEFWNKEYYAIWESEINNETTSLDQLTGLVDTGFLAEVGTDNFVPFVHVKFRDTGEKLGASCVLHALDKIDEANREATRLTQMLFRYNKALWVVSANDKDSSGRPLPAPKIKQNSLASNDGELKDDSILYMPGMSNLQALVPPLDYASALSILNSMLDELREDLPELKYFALNESQLSSKAIRLMLAGAIDRAEEARENIISGLERVIQMALTVGSFWNLFSVGTYENRDFTFTIQAAEMFPATEDEVSTTLKTLVEAGIPLPSAMRKAGYSEQEIETAILERQSEDERKTNLSNQSLANSLMSFNRE